MGGVNKLLLPVAGEPLLRRSVTLYREAGLPVTLVVGPDHAALLTALAGLEFTLAVNPELAGGADDSGGDGQQASVRVGLGAARLEAEGVMIALADLPLLDSADIAALIDRFHAFGGKRVIVPRHAGIRGHPVILPSALVRALRASGQSPRAFMDTNPQGVAWFEAATEHYTADLDTPGDAARLLGAQPDGARTP